MSTFKLKIITPDKVFYDGEAVQLIAKTAAGNVGILKGHMPYVANIVPSPLRISENGTDYRIAAVSSGIVKVEGDLVTVVTTAVEWAEVKILYHLFIATLMALVDLRATKIE